VHHSGIDDSRNIGNIFSNLVTMGLTKDLFITYMQIVDYNQKWESIRGKKNRKKISETIGKEREQSDTNAKTKNKTQTNINFFAFFLRILIDFCFNKLSINFLRKKFFIFQKMQRIVPGLWIHVESQVAYKVLGIARDVKNPQVVKVIYESTQESLLRETNELLPIGTLWSRDPKDFGLKFLKNYIVSK
jgi:hypothetical protein